MQNVNSLEIVQREEDAKDCGLDDFCSCPMSRQVSNKNVITKVQYSSENKRVFHTDVVVIGKHVVNSIFLCTYALA